MYRNSVGVAAHSCADRSMNEAAEESAKEAECSPNMDGGIENYVLDCFGLENELVRSLLIARAGLLRVLQLSDFPLHALSTLSGEKVIQIVEILLRDCATAVLYEDQVSSADAVLLDTTDGPQDGNLPLHCCVAGPHIPSFDIFRMLVESYPQAVAIHGQNGETPLHAAIAAGAPLHIIDVLLEAVPEAVRCRDNFHNFPLHLAATMPGPPLYRTEVVNRLIDVWPEALGRTNNYERTPLHRAVTTDRPCIRTVYALASQHPVTVARQGVWWASFPAVQHFQRLGREPSFDVIETLCQVDPSVCDQLRTATYRPLQRAYSRYEWIGGLVQYGPCYRRFKLLELLALIKMRRAKLVFSAAAAAPDVSARPNTITAGNSNNNSSAMAEGASRETVPTDGTVVVPIPRLALPTAPEPSDAATIPSLPHQTQQQRPHTAPNAPAVSRHDTFSPIQTTTSGPAGTNTLSRTGHSSTKGSQTTRDASVRSLSSRELLQASRTRLSAVALTQEHHVTQRHTPAEPLPRRKTDAGLVGGGVESRMAMSELRVPDKAVVRTARASHCRPELAPRVPTDWNRVRSAEGRARGIPAASSTAPVTTGIDNVRLIDPHPARRAPALQPPPTPIRPHSSSVQTNGASNASSPADPSAAKPGPAGQSTSHGTPVGAETEAGMQGGEGGEEEGASTSRSPSPRIRLHGHWVTPLQSACVACFQLACAVDKLNRGASHPTPTRVWPHTARVAVRGPRLAAHPTQPRPLSAEPTPVEPWVPPGDRVLQNVMSFL